MRALCKSAAILLIVGFFGSPTMACLVNSAAMSAAEHACCRHMAGKCGSISNSCCKTEIRSATAYVSVTLTSAPPPAIYGAAPITVPSWSAPQQPSFARGAIEHPPPEFLSHNTVLRI